MNIIIVTKNGVEEKFRNVDYETIYNRDDIKYLEINNYNKKTIEINKSIEVLKMNLTSLIEFPRINGNKISSILIKTAKIERIPDLSHLTNLEELKVEDAYINQINYPFPINIKNINLTYNQLKDDIFDNLSFYPKDLVEFDIGHNFITKHPPKNIRHKVKYSNNNIEEKLIFIQVIDDAMWDRDRDVNMRYMDNIRNAARNNNDNNNDINRVLDNLGNMAAEIRNDNVRRDLNNYRATVRLDTRPNQPNMFDTRQTVHITSINDSASRSIKKILELTENYPIVEDFEDDIFYNFYGNFVMRFLFYSSKIWRIKLILNDTSVHSITRVTYKKLLERVWQLIKHHEMKRDLIERLKTEVEESLGYCFTGRINRLVNSLTGIVDGIGITISTKEEVQNEINLVIKKLSENKINKEKALEEFEQIFEGRDLEENYKNAWIEALQDYD